jgi:uncharacterized protein Yka (UPF0111/DUF47 family)
MARGTLAVLATLLLPIAPFAGCATNEARQGLADVAALTTRIDRVRQSAALAGQRVDAAIKSLQAIARSDFTGNTEALYDEFVASVDASEKQAGELRDSIDSMKHESDALFRSWRESLAGFAEEPLRRHSEERQASVHERFEAVVIAAETARTGCEAVNRTLRDHVAYMRYDFNAASLAVLQAEIAAVAQCATTLAARFTACEEAAKSYVEAASFRPPAPPPTGSADLPG